MRLVFADTHYYLALLNAKDDHHEVARLWTAEYKGLIVTSEWVLLEVADAFWAPRNRALFNSLRDSLIADKHTVIVPASSADFTLGCELFRQRQDKEWSLTDCISYELMRRWRITEALTADHHFSQAGFIALF